MSLNRKLSRYESLGFGLLFFGAPLALYSYQVLLNVPFMALGLACAILGVTLLWIPDNPVPTRQIRAMVEGACINIEAVLEEFDATEKAVFMPPRDGRVYSFVPLMSDSSYDLRELSKAPYRVLTEVSGKPGLILFPPGSEAVRLSLIPEELGVEEALNYVLVDFLEALKSVKAIEEDEGPVVEMMSPRMRTDFPRFKRVLGSLPSTLAGCVIVTVIGKPLTLVNEEVDEDRIRCVFKVEDSG